MKRVFDRRVQFDERSRKFQIRSIVPKKPRSFTWRVNVSLDQGSEGACVGFAWAHEIAARPKPLQADDHLAREKIYREAQKIDEWPGEDYEGTSVLAGAKVVKQMGYMLEYRWAFGLDDLRLAVGYVGPAVIGVHWREGMLETDPAGFITATGSVLGGHAVVIHGVSVSGDYFKGKNSWGAGWGVNGEFKVSFDDMAMLLANEGEACIPVGRLIPRATT